MLSGRWTQSADGHFKSSTQHELAPHTPDYLFVLEDATKRAEFDKSPSVREIFIVNGTGIITKRDALTIHFSPSEVWHVVEEFVRTPDRDLHKAFKLPEDVRDWKADWAKRDLIESGPSQSNVQKITYRPFDERFTYNTGNSRGFLGWPVQKLMRHMVPGNVALITARTNKSPWPNHFFVTVLPAETKAGESTVQSYNFPLFVVGATGELNQNLSTDFRNFIDSRYDHHYTPEEILGYIYAVLYAPVYRARYAEFLRRDFPRIPFPEAKAEFEALSKLGWSLVQAHLLRDFPRRGLATYRGKGDHVVEAVRYDPEQAIWINETQGFVPVPQGVWDFHIGGYQVLDKYLKSRKGRALSLDEINHVSTVTDALAFTISQMAKIDEAYRAAFPDRG